MNDGWTTPKWLMAHFSRHFDPCPENPLFDGLSRDWESPAFVNPPYSQPKLWIAKAIEQQKLGTDVVLLLRADTSTGWFRSLVGANCHIAFFNERLRFSGSKGSPNFCSMLIFLQGKREAGT